MCKQNLGLGGTSGAYIWDNFDLVMFNVSLGAFGAFLPRCYF